MRCLEILVQEHGILNEALDALSLALDKLEKGEKPPRKFFENALEFIQTYVNKYHNCKEEYVLFEMLSQKRSRDIVTQIESLKYQHERARNQTAEMAKSLNGYEKGDEIQKVKLIENLAAYISLLRMHLKWENSIFYPAARKEITEKEEQMLLEDFQKEDKKMTAGSIKHCTDLVKDMRQLL